MLERLNPFKSRARVAVLVVALAGAGATATIVGRNLLSDDDNGPTVDGTVNTITIETGSVESIEGAGGQSRLHIRLSQGQEQADQADRLPVAAGDPLNDEEIQAILDRLPELEIERGDVEAFNLPDALIPPPRPGETVEEPFPPPPVDVRPASVPEGPLEVLRFSPEGEIPLAPFLNVTFNQPMVPLTTLEDLAAEDVPVKISPAIPGRWKWLGTKTLSFEYSSDTIDRFPMATEYVAEIPAGTESAVGGVLPQTVRWRFTTPPVEIDDFFPQFGPQKTDPLLFASFNQNIDPEAVLSTIEIQADGEAFALRLANADEIEADEQVSRLVRGSLDGRWLAFRATRPFPNDANVQVTIGPGTPSAEGPLLGSEALRFSFNTYAPLRIVEHECGYSDDCAPFQPFSIRFNNPLDPELFDETKFSIDPPIPGVTVGVFGNNISIRGATKGRTTYVVTIDGSITDIFGQTLGEDENLRFRVGSAPKSLSGPSDNLITLDPSADKPVFTVYSINYNRLRVRAYAVQPSDWPAYNEYRREFFRRDEAPSPPGQEVMNETISIESVDDVLTETAIDLSDALDGDYGHLIVVVDPPRSILPINRDQRDVTVQAWVQVTQIGLDAYVDHSEMVIWATALADGAPLDGLEIRLHPGGFPVTTGSDGLVQVEIPAGGVTMLTAQTEDDLAILPNNPFYWSEEGWKRQPVRDEMRWYVFDDRQMYRPGEEVHVKGWVRRIGGGQNGDVGLFTASNASIRYQLMGPQGNELINGSVEVNALGGFDLSLQLPDNANLGFANLIFNASGFGDAFGKDYYHSLQIQEFRRPEFEVTARTETSGPYLVGDNAVVAVSANYFAGGPLPNAEVNWNVTSSPSNYSPPNWSDFIFGAWTPWWYFYSPVVEEVFYEFGPEGFDGSEVEFFSGLTDASGEHFLRLDFDEADEHRPYSVMAEATVIDVNRQAWAAGTNLLVHPSELYVGLRSERTFVQRGTPLEIEAIVVDIDGNAILGQTFEVRAARLEWRFKSGNWREEEVDVQVCSAESTSEPINCEFETLMGGTYRISAQVADEQGRINESQFTRWVSGGQRPPARNVERETVTLIPDKETYKPGDVAEILVQAPFSPAEGLLSVTRSGLLYTERFDIEDGTQTLRIPIEDRHIPNLNIQVDVVGAAPRTSDLGEIMPDVPKRPAYATGGLNLAISNLSRELIVDAAPRDERLEPGGETVIDVNVIDAGGRPVSGAEVAVVVVDEAILALTNYQLSDPLSAFYSFRSSEMMSTYGRASIVLANPESLGEQIEGNLARVVTESAVVEEAEADFAMAAEEPAPMMAAGAAMDDAAAPEPIRVRTDFNPLATFAPVVSTDSDGRAQVQVELPDNLTRYRVMAVAVADGNLFGNGESNLTARLPLMVRPSAPRFLNFGDRLELPVVLQNQTDDDLAVDVVVEATNLELTETAGQRVMVPANDRVEVRFPAITDRAGTVRLQFAAVSGTFADAASIELPVYTPATTEAFATYGVVDEGAISQPVASPSDVFPQFGGLEINTSSTALQALTDAVLYLAVYPYECSEQISSRMLAIAALRDVLSAFEAEGLPAPAELENTVQRDIETLRNMQNGDGGFPIWARGRETIPYYSIHTAHALQRARLKGFDVPEDMMQRLSGYLREIESFYPHWYGQQLRWTLSSYALYVRDLMGDTDPGKAGRLFDEAGMERLSLEAVAWLWQVMEGAPGYESDVEAIERLINNRAVETAGAANFTTDYGEEAYLLLHSDRRTDGVILDALINGQPESDLIPKVVNGLLAHRTRGRWSNTQENAFILLALDRYFNTFEAQTPDFVAQIWLGDTYAGGHEFVGRTTERHETNIPMSYLVDVAEGEQDLILSKEGPGRLYYRLGLSYAPTDLLLDPLDAGFVVQRQYEAVDDPEDVYQDDEGIWHIKAGARVRVRLTMVADNRRYHVALVDPLPAGLEIVNPALAVSGSIPQDPNDSDNRYGWWWWGTWYEHQNMRDERAEAFATLLWEGVHNYSYVARATTPGTFVVPPAKAEEMYSPEVFGRSGTDWVIIE